MDYLLTCRVYDLQQNDTYADGAVGSGTGCNSPACIPRGAAQAHAVVAGVEGLRGGPGRVGDGRPVDPLVGALAGRVVCAGPVIEPII